MLIPLLLALQGQPAQKLTLQEYRVDAGHSIVEWSVPFTVTHVKGRFPQTLGTILYDPAAPENSSVSVVIEAKSIDSGWEHRDEHLKTEDFFDVEKYPTITFQSQRLERSGDNWIARGPFTMHGVTKEIAIPFRFVSPPFRSKESGWMMLFVAGGLRINRRDFGVNGAEKHNSWFNAARQATVGDTVEISLELEAYYADAGQPRSQGITDALERVRTTGVDSLLARLAARRGDKTDEQWTPYFGAADPVLRALVADGRVPEAVALSRGLTTLFPALPRAWLTNAFVLDVSGDRRGSTRSYDKAREVFRPRVVDPNERFPQIDENWYWIDQLAQTAMQWGKTREAANLARVAAALWGAPATESTSGNAAYTSTSYGSAARANVTLGIALWLTGDVAGARASLARAVALDPRETRAIEWQRRLKG